MGNRDNTVSTLDWKEFVSSSNEIIAEELKINISNDALLVAGVIETLSKL